MLETYADSQKGNVQDGEEMCRHHPHVQRTTPRGSAKERIHVHTQRGSQHSVCL